ncbi:Fur family transcriptional regulator [Cohnella caldifontis]|uniref:Fur family transcriptional regulator n=1 Tax=Cohnella caldifontis TaxID=3027471 RepID=UPI0023EBA867|nr:Fur family transcriptional regulator [Cohnella sp. YIM B05605]
MGETERIVQRMSDQGLRITEQRRTLAQLFAEAPGYLTPKEIYDHMQRVYPGLSFDTVYRNLRVMQELDVIEQFMLEEGVKFKRSCGEPHHHHHMICLQCEKTVPIRSCPMPDTAVPSGFEVVRHKFEVYGYCADCRESGDRAQASAGRTP